MKILHTVEMYEPSVGGMQEVVKQISEGLVKLGHEVTVATTQLPGRSSATIGGVNIAEFALSGNLVCGINGEVERYREFLLNSDFDVITNFAAQQWATDIALSILNEIRARKVFVPTGFSGLHNPDFSAYFEQMKGWMAQYDMNVFLSHDYRDINFARANGITRYRVIPNGASASEFLSEGILDVRQKLGIHNDYFLILHVGSHTGMKGHAEAIEIFRQAKLRKAVFLLVGNNFYDAEKSCTRECRSKGWKFNLSPQRLKDKKKLLVAPLTRAETVAAYRQADLFLFPSNIECSPIVLFECMAAKTPFMSTDVGNAAEIARLSQGGLILPTVFDRGLSRAKIPDAAVMLEELYRDEQKRKALGEAGFAAWEKNYTWDKIARDYEELYRGLLA